MSIRPVNIDEFTETSFEDIEASVSPTNWKKRSQQSSPLRDVAAAPSTASSESTTFSNDKKRYSTHTESDEDGGAFLDDFEEFHGKAGRDEIVKSHFENVNLEPTFRPSTEAQESEGDDELQELTRRFGNKFDIKSRHLSGAQRPRSAFKTFKQPQSMMDLRESTTRPSSRSSHELTNSKSASNLRSGSRLGPRGIQYKKSVPALSKYDMIREEDEQDNYNDEFEDELKFEKSLLQPQFLPKEDEGSLLDLSPSQYTITADDSILTPQLHKRHRDWVRPSQLEMFREPLRHEKPAVKHRGSRKLSVSHRLKTIKQEIDHNTPMKKGRMVYNPETLKWEGNEQALAKFRDVDSFDKKALVIQGRPDLQPPRERSSSTRSGTRKHGKVVGRMMFDQDNLRWIRLDGDEKDPFAEIPDYIPPVSFSEPSLKKKLPTKRSQSQFAPSRDQYGGRYPSSATTRYHSLNTPSSSSDPTFNIDSKSLERFYHEENKWSKKVGGWFILGDAEAEGYGADQELPDPKNNSYMYEIRNMVMSSARN